MRATRRIPPTQPQPPCEPQRWLAAEPAAVLAALASERDGLAVREAAARLARYGPNSIPAPRGIGPLQILLAQFLGPMPTILGAAVAIALLAGEWVDAGAIAAIFVLNAVLGFVQEDRAERTLEHLRAMASPTAQVVRAGVRQTVAAAELVPGDVIHLEAGDQVPADARLIEAFALQTQEAALTGESTPVEKDTRSLGDPAAALADWQNTVLLGSNVSAGRGRAVVVRTGEATALGQIAGTVRGIQRESTPLQRRLAEFASGLGLWVLAIAVVVFAAGLLRGGEWIETLIAAVALAVAAIPEGLPAVVTIALSIGVRRMAARQVLVRKLSSVETLGSTTVICSDKTGTLTRNVMTVRRIWVGGRELDPGGDVERAAAARTPPPDLRRLLESAVLCNDAHPSADGGWMGDPTEGALLDAAVRLGLPPEDCRKQWPRVDEIPFSSERKRMTTVHVRAGGPGVLVCCKGALDHVLPLCSRWLAPEGERALNAETRALIESRAADAGDNALRVLAVAYHEGAVLPQGQAATEREREVESDLTLAGLVAMVDPPRPNVREALATCRGAGVRVVMITGDHARTAAAIGRELGITGTIVTGAELSRMSDGELETVAAEAALFARVDPAHKLQLVEALQKRGQVVAMTGDGVNDAPALQRANIGVAMGISGTAVAKEAADMVLLDDHFQSIVAAVEEGRAIYANIRKFVLYLLSCNLSEVAVILIALLIGFPLPLLAVQILLMNLITDGLPALALGVDPRQADIMQRPPRPVTERLLGRAQVVWMLATAAVMTLATLLVYGWVLATEGLSTARTMAFVTLSAAQLFQAFNTKVDGAMWTRRLVFENRALWAAAGSSLAVIALVLYTPLNSVFGVEPLGWADCVLAIVAASAVLLANRAFQRRVALAAPIPP